MWPSHQLFASPEPQYLNGLALACKAGGQRLISEEGNIGI